MLLLKHCNNYVATVDVDEPKNGKPSEFNSRDDGQPHNWLHDWPHDWSPDKAQDHEENVKNCDVSDGSFALLRVSLLRPRHEAICHFLNQNCNSDVHWKLYIVHQQ